jgi:hypothetical protein
MVKDSKEQHVGYKGVRGKQKFKSRRKWKPRRNNVDKGKE